MSRRHRQATKSARKRRRAVERAVRERKLLAVRGPQRVASAAPPPPKMTGAEKAADERAANRLLARLFDRRR